MAGASRNLLQGADGAIDKPLLSKYDRYRFLVALDGKPAEILKTERPQPLPKPFRQFANGEWLFVNLARWMTILGYSSTG